jgi:hypothetical protein
VKQVLAEQGPIVTPDEVYHASGILDGYHERFYDSWGAVLEAAGALDGAFPAPIGERLRDLGDERQPGLVLLLERNFICVAL